MNLFDYLFACSFWQWIGTIALAGVVAEGVGCIIENALRKSKP